MGTFVYPHGPDPSTLDAQRRPPYIQMPPSSIPTSLQHQFFEGVQIVYPRRASVAVITLRIARVDGRARKEVGSGRRLDRRKLIDRDLGPAADLGKFPVIEDGEVVELPGARVRSGQPQHDFLLWNHFVDVHEVVK